MIDPRLQTLRVLHEQGTVTATAQALYLTPSTVSQQLRQLSRDLGVALLEAEGRRVRLTSAAVTLLEHADVLHAQAERARADLAAHRAGAAGHLRLCGVSTALAALVAPAAALLRDTHPRLTVEMSEEDSDRCFHLLLTGRTDVGVLIPTPDSPAPDDSRFEQQPLLDEPQDLLVATTHPFAERERVALSEAARESWIGSPERIDEHQLLLVACATAGFTPRITQHGKEWSAISAMVAHGFGICLVPRLAHIPPEHDVVRVPLWGEPTPSRRLITCIRRGSEQQPAVMLGLEALREVRRRRTDVALSHPQPAP
jgi:DNA-binding transcriptional LysR family regulator